MNILLERFAYLPTATFGRLYIPNVPSLITVERPWVGNLRGESCIPEGVYSCAPFSGSKFKDVFQVLDVPDRTYILFHAANYPSELQGCIAPGTELMPRTAKEEGVMNSGAAMKILKEAVPADGFTLEITHFSPEYP